jgi:ferredoxin
MKIEADREICCSSGMCVLTAPDLFDQDEEDGRVMVLEPSPTDQGQQALARQAAQLCPSRAISVSE